MAWESGVTYQGGGVDDEFQDLVTLTNANAMYLCKYTHTASADNHPSNGTATGGWNKDKPWIVTEKKDFIAADVMWTDTFRSTMMSTISAYIEDLVVSKLSTNSQGENGPKIIIENGNMLIQGQQGKTNIEIGINDYGEAVLRFYDNNGKFQYDLGPTQITNQTGRKAARYVSTTGLALAKDESGYVRTSGPYAKMKFWIDSQNNQFVHTPYTIYQFLDGELKVSQLFYYTTKQNIASTGDADFTYQEGNHSEYHGKYFTSQADYSASSPDRKDYVGKDEYVTFISGLIPLRVYQGSAVDSNMAWYRTANILMFKNGEKVFECQACINPYSSRTASAPSTSSYFVWFHDANGWENLGPCGPNNSSMTNTRDITYAYYKERYTP